MMNNMPAGQGPPGANQYHGRRQHPDYNPYMNPAAHMAYGYHNPSHYHNPYQSQQWYNPYYAQQSYQPQPYHSQHRPQHHLQHQAPLVVGHPHAQPFVPSTRPPPSVPQPARTPLHDPPTPSTASQNFISPATTPTVASHDTQNITPATAAASVVQAPPTPPPAPRDEPKRMPFYPPLPWHSVSPDDFPRRLKRRIAKLRKQEDESAALTLPSQLSSSDNYPETGPADPRHSDTVTESRAVASEENKPAAIEIEASAPAVPLGNAEAAEQSQEAPASQQAPAPISAKLPAAHQTSSSAAKPAVPIVPAVPKVRSPPASRPTPPDASIAVPGPKPDGVDDVAVVGTPVVLDAVAKQDVPEVAVEAQAEAPKPVSAVPKSWASLLHSANAAKTSAANGAPNGTAVNGIAPPKATSLADALRNYSVDGNHKVHFLEPRGLINTGNMCYMNSILQMLVFCAPFYELLDEVSKLAVHSFKSDTPLIDAMIMFLKEYNIIETASSTEQLRSRLNVTELKQDGASFAPEHVYEVIKQLPRFSTMRRGHQQDAEEFLGFLLDGLHEECVSVIRKSGSVGPAVSPSDAHSDVTSTAGSGEINPGDGWMEVGPKQKASTTQSSGDLAIESPITKTFGGKLRSEFRVPGQKTSITLEPYQPLQLDIGSPEISNISQALKGLTKSETIQGHWETPRGPATTAQKQVFVETLPPILILHLKRFQYDSSGGTQKIWKKIGYPLELEIPKEVFPPNKRAQLGMRPGGLPKYRLTSVVYHHGKSATGGHYTADLRRQDGRSWVRFDDTVITRPTSDEVANEGGEEDPKVLAAALESHKRNDSMPAASNIYQGFDQDEPNENGDDNQGWSTVNGNSPATNKKWSAIANGNGSSASSATGKATPRPSDKFSVKDNKVAYILFYERIGQ